MKSSVFTDDEYTLAYPVGIENNFWSLSRISILERNLSQFGLTSKRILEIGCGKGIVVDALRRKGLDCMGVELAAIEPLEQVKKFVINNQDANTLDASFRNRIEVILLLDVIEHIRDVGLFFQELRKAFVNATWVVITVPARKEFWSNYDEFYGHFRRYDLEMMRELGRSIGFQTIKHRYFFGSLYWVGMVSFRIFGKRELRGRAPAGAMIVLHRIIAAILFLEYSLTPGRFRGSSILAMYKSK